MSLVNYFLTCPSPSDLWSIKAVEQEGWRIWMMNPREQMASVVLPYSSPPFHSIATSPMRLLYLQSMYQCIFLKFTFSACVALCTLQVVNSHIHAWNIPSSSNILWPVLHTNKAITWVARECDAWHWGLGKGCRLGDSEVKVSVLKQVADPYRRCLKHLSFPKHSQCRRELPFSQSDFQSSPSPSPSPTWFPSVPPSSSFVSSELPLRGQWILSCSLIFML